MNFSASVIKCEKMWGREKVTQVKYGERRGGVRSCRGRGQPTGKAGKVQVDKGLMIEWQMSGK